MIHARDSSEGRPRLLKEPKPSPMASWPLHSLTGVSPKIEGKLLCGIARVESKPNLAFGFCLVLIACDTNGSKGLTSTLSHDRGWRAACIVTMWIPRLLIATHKVARGVTAMVVGSGALLGHCSVSRRALEIACTLQCKLKLLLQVHASKRLVERCVADDLIIVGARSALRCRIEMLDACIFLP
jgi:hypothetical protein